MSMMFYAVRRGTYLDLSSSLSRKTISFSICLNDSLEKYCSYSLFSFKNSSSMRMFDKGKYGSTESLRKAASSLDYTLMSQPILKALDYIMKWILGK